MGLTVAVRCTYCSPRLLDGEEDAREGGRRMKDYCEDCGQVEWLCICKGEGEDGE